jgi:hypothetical protein
MAGLVCWCFGITRADIRRDLTERGETDALERIKRGIAEGRCACAEKNPKGSCCLGDAAAEIRSIQASLKK